MFKVPKIIKIEGLGFLNWSKNEGFMLVIMEWDKNFEIIIKAVFSLNVIFLKLSTLPYNHQSATSF